MTILYGTSNPAKLSYMRKRLKTLNIEIMGLNDLTTPAPNVPETGKTPLENARQKALAYYEIFRLPVFSCDSGLYFDNVPGDIQPGVHVRTINGKTLSDEEMLLYYSGLAEKYGGCGGLRAKYKNAVCFVKDKEHIFEAMESSMESEPFMIAPKPHKNGIVKKGFPLDCLSVDMKTGKYYYDLAEEELDKVAVEDGFLEFFRKICKCI
ncbi:MAG: hypothetical protein NC409_14040 [Clostridium sp.]|nr:hypothetical protein [Clostridium sp.]